MTDAPMPRPHLAVVKDREGTAASGVLPLFYDGIPANVTIEALLREPGADGWGPIETVTNPKDCQPGLTLCADRECMEGWAEEHYLRVLANGVAVWTSPDVPSAQIS